MKKWISILASIGKSFSLSLSLSLFQALIFSFLSLLLFLCLSSSISFSLLQSKYLSLPAYVNVPNWIYLTVWSISMCASLISLYVYADVPVCYNKRLIFCPKDGILKGKRPRWAHLALLNNWRTKLTWSKWKANIFWAEAIYNRFYRSRGQFSKETFLHKIMLR